MTQQGDMTSQQPGASQPGDGTAGADLGRLSPGAAREGADPGGRPPGTPRVELTPAGAPGPPGAPYWPSPYLAEGQSAPEAYPAPARPGQPRYADPAGQIRPGPAGRRGRPGFGQPGPPGGRARGGPVAEGGLAMPAGAGPRSAAGATDLMLASAWERLLAMTLDWLLILVASFLLLHEQMAQLVDRLQAQMTAAQAFGPTAEQNALLNFEKNPATISALVSYFLLVFLIALAYFWALEARGGATLGKRLLGLRVVNLPGQTPAGVWSAGVRTILFLAGPAIFAFAGAWGISLVSLLGGALWFADSVVLATDPQKRSLHDRLAGTTVVRKVRSGPSAR
jgi:uncharacterized RDD family membrane protein YckC